MTKCQLLVLVVGKSSRLWSAGMGSTGREVFVLHYQTPVQQGEIWHEEGAGSAFVAMLGWFVLGWKSWADPPPPPDALGLPFPLQCPWHKQSDFVGCLQTLQREGSAFQVINQLCSCNLRSPPWCLTQSLLCAPCVKHQDIPQELLIYFANSALLCGSQTSNGLWSSKMSELNSRSFKNLLYYMKDLTLSTCWVFGSWKADILQREFVKLRHPGPGLLNAVVKLGGRKKL